MKRVGIAILILVVCQDVSARVFNLGGVSLGTYLKASGGTSQMGADAFRNAGGVSALTFGDGAAFGFAGEFGVAFDSGPVLTRVGFELYRPQKLSQYEVTNDTGSAMYTVDSDVISFSPVLSFEFILEKTQTSKSYILAGGGYSYLTLKNTFSFTAAGASQLGHGDFVEDAKGNTIFGFAGVGYEMLMVDNVTFSMEAGYRYMEASKLTLKSATNSLVGSKSEGDALKNHDGGDRSLNLSQPFISILFKFYI